MNVTGGWVLWALLSAVFAAATAILAKLGLEGVNSDYATFFRAAVIVLLLGLFVKASGQWINPLQLSSRNWVFLALSAVATGASWLCYFRALQIGEAARVAPLDKLSVVLVALFAIAFLGERPSARDWTGISLVTAGALLLSLRR
jgi:transporter family protein